VTDTNPPSPTPQTGTPQTGTHRILALSGSLRAGSSNTGLVKLALSIAEELAPGRLSVDWVDDIDLLPYYNQDIDTEATLPAAARRWREAVAAADALLLGLPEYNGGASAVAKNAIDWASRPMGGQVLTGKIVAMVSSGGGAGGTNVQAGLAPALAWLGNTIVEESPVTIAMGMTKIDGAGNTSDPDVVAAVRGKVEAMLAALDAR
jgi:NAD(P)H-dependent FMN reductase